MRKCWIVFFFCSSILSLKKQMAIPTANEKKFIDNLLVRGFIENYANLHLVRTFLIFLIIVEDFFCCGWKKRSKLIKSLTINLSYFCHLSMGTERQRIEEYKAQQEVQCLFKILILCIDVASSQNIYFSNLKPFCLPDLMRIVDTGHCARQGIFVCFLLNLFIVVQLNLRQIFSFVCEIGAMWWMPRSHLSFKAPQSLKFPENTIMLRLRKLMRKESINHKTPNNDSMGSLLLYVQLLLFRTLKSRVYHCWVKYMAIEKQFSKNRKLKCWVKARATICMIYFLL